MVSGEAADSRQLASLLSYLQKNWQVYETGSVVGRTVAVTNKTRRVPVLQQFGTDGSTNWWPLTWHCCGNTYHCCETLFGCLINNFLRQFWRNVLSSPFKTTFYFHNYLPKFRIRALFAGQFIYAGYYQEFCVLSESVSVLLRWVQEFLTTDTMP